MEYCGPGLGVAQYWAWPNCGRSFMDYHKPESYGLLWPRIGSGPGLGVAQYWAWPNRGRNFMDYHKPESYGVLWPRIGSGPVLGVAKLWPEFQRVKS
jgi:hypothetical protein